MIPKVKCAESRRKVPRQEVALCTLRLSRYLRLLLLPALIICRFLFNLLTPHKPPFLSLS